MFYFRMKTIPLHNGNVTIVDDDMYDFLSQYRWTHSKYPMTQLHCEIHGMDYRKPYSMHHLVIGFPINGLQVDHINRDKLDNRRCNLRIVTRSENCKNRSMYRAVTDQEKTKQYKAHVKRRQVLKRKREKKAKWFTVFQSKKKYLLYAHINDKHTFLGLFANKEDACYAKHFMLQFFQSFDHQ
jgi:hypothetical protein